MECGVQYLYPPDDLLPVLVDYYFQNLNPYLPLLHRPSFERALTDRRHHTDVGFGSVVMLVCSIGARWSDDRRCCLEGTGAHSAGWKWFDQVQVHRKSFMGPPRLYDLQIYAVSTSVFLSFVKPFLILFIVYLVIVTLPTVLLVSPVVVDDGWHWFTTRPGCWCT